MPKKKDFIKTLPKTILNEQVVKQELLHAYFTHNRIVDLRNYINRHLVGNMGSFANTQIHSVRLAKIGRGIIMIYCYAMDIDAINDKPCYAIEFSTNIYLVDQIVVHLKYKKCLLF